ncbi:MAG: hypothetical protein GF329_20515 [Candidatus Lokiarchaeota archaeon]|nr:hypothetical protein [Candidatus Lokiarchaeota archaeon]
MKNFDMIFVHPPRNFEYLLSNIKVRSAYVMMPMGLLGLCDLLYRKGFSAKIINYPLEKILDLKFSLIKELKNVNFKVLGVDLHWVLHSAGGLDILRLVKKYFPNCFTLMGGYSATYFADEILSDHKYIDGIIQGDAEEPLVSLLKNLDSLDKVPNLIYRDENGKIVNNKITYVAQELDSLNFAKVKYLDHWKEYINYNYEIMHFPWPVEMARGCIYNCVNCGGSSHSCKIISKRNNVVFRAPERVVDDLKDLMEVSDVKGIFYGHGLYPKTEDYFLEIQRLIREEKLDIHADLEIWRLPLSKKYARDFARTYNLEKSLLWFSVRSFSESYRKKYHEYFGNFDDAFNFSNKEIQELIDTTRLYDIPFRLFWDVGNPYETGLDLLFNVFTALKILVKNISKKDKVSMWSEPINISPGCPVELYSENFGVNMFVKSFKDYVELNRKSKMLLPPMDVTVNYRTNYLTRTGINLMNKAMTLINLISVITG